MRERFRPSDYRFLTICLLLLAASAWFSVRYFHRAFPEASIDFRVNRDDAGSQAAGFLADRGYRIAGYRHAARFNFDDNAKTFLERELGLEQANRIMGSHVRLWQWSNRWFRPQQKEEFSAAVTPSGEVVEFAHEIPEADARNSIAEADARIAAENFLRTVMRRDPGSLEFVEGSSVTRPKRTDHIFTWKERDFDVKDATYRIEVTVLGDEVGGYREYLKVPEQWLRDYEHLRSKNQAAGMIDSAAVVLLILGLLVTLMMSVRRRQIRWRPAILIGSAGAVLSFLSSWNEFPLNEFGYPTTDSYASFVTNLIFMSILSALAWGAFLLILTAAAEPVYRAAFGGQISIGNLFRPAALRTRRFFLGTVLGLALTGIFIAYQIVFYILASRMGAWSPAEVPYSDLLNTRLPWAFVLFGGFMPAVFEEFLFRVFAIPFLRKFVRYTSIAVVLAAFLWGFGHAGYPNQPFYIRGVEVGIGGVALGLIMLRWGVLPTLVWHYSVDAMYSALLLMRSNSLYFQFSGAAAAGIMVLPAAAALAAYFWKGGFEPDTSLTNEAETKTIPPPVPDLPAALETVPAEFVSYRGWSLTRRVIAAAGFAVGLILMMIPTARVDDHPRYRIGANEARDAASRFLREQGADPASFQNVVWPGTHWEGSDSLAGKYFLERRPVSRVASMFEKNRPIQHWRIRYFKELDKEEWTVAIHPETGRVTGFDHALPDDRPGADIPSGQAVAIASSFATGFGADLSNTDLKESTSDKKKARRDHTLVWEARPGDVRDLDEAHYRVRVAVAGDRVTSVASFWKIPEAYERSRSQQNAVSISTIVAKALIFGALIVGGVVILIQRTRKGEVRWRPVLFLSAPFSVATFTAFLLTLHLMWQNYQTAIPFGMFRIVIVSSAVMALVFTFLMVCGSLVAITVLRPGALTAFGGAARRAFGADALLAALLAVGLAAIVQRCHALLENLLHAYATVEVAAPTQIASLSPLLSILSSALGSIPMNLAGLAVAVYLIGHVRARWMPIPIAVLAAMAMASQEVRTPAELAFAAALAVLPLVAVVVFVVFFARDNWLAYALAVLAFDLNGGAARLFAEPNPALQIQAWLLVAILTIVLAWVALPAFRGKPQTSL
jgi:membrane protease YdiL (CAAX protease family)